ncbi:uncharacterized protein L969DRAFT_423992 [Mixia osmundae IAM 14324]|uniref:uncharacterized protein n=1 Tax=Mixia osmundae (strain CBS 9802 / IAM 14324 / JCM 22182 / KY 12970) TaxID=764103 RepID=UPI0004A55723|nr:uncharacterized protein L969DRAFT_423992 [Mixia osmundae IAM 14324]KEI40398.1 hypothetical protein L969DRAFT_423992 [Mixia osmundae IAM 14324]
MKPAESSLLSMQDRNGCPRASSTVIRAAGFCWRRRSTKSIATSDTPWLPSGEDLTTRCGTMTYLAPEVLVRTDKKGYDQAVDAWAIGASQRFGSPRKRV